MGTLHKILIVAIVLLGGGASYGDVDGVLKLDFDNILVNMPASGYVELQAKDDVSLMFEMTYICNSYKIEIVRPDLSSVFVDKTTIHGELSGLCSGRIPTEQKLVAGNVYRIPLFLLKFDDNDFVFDLPGDYLIKFTINDLPKPVTFVSSVSVGDCNDCGLKEYEESLPPGRCITPFGNIKITSYPEFQEGDAYAIGSAIYQAYNCGGPLMSAILHPDAEGDVFLRPIYSRWLQEGEMRAAEAGCNLGFWEAMRNRMTRIETKAKAPFQVERDRKGVVWIRP